MIYETMVKEAVNHQVTEIKDAIRAAPSLSRTNSPYLWKVPLIVLSTIRPELGSRALCSCGTSAEATIHLVPSTSYVRAKSHQRPLSP